jgi:ATP-dependent Clp protease, protease subunit
LPKANELLCFSIKKPNQRFETDFARVRSKPLNRNVRALSTTIRLMPHTEVWLTFVGILDLPITRVLVGEFTAAVAAQVERLHLLIQSPGGNVNEGVFLFNYINALPIEVVAYNCGHIGSAAVTAYLGAKKRIVSPNATFLVHKASSATGNSGGVEQMNATVRSLAIDDARTEALLKGELRLSRKQLASFSRSALTLSAQDAIAVGAAHEIGHFKPSGLLRNV